jgi:hypothetical protein
MTRDGASGLAAGLKVWLAGVKPSLGQPARDDLRADVWAYVDHLKAEGWPPERVSVAVKRVAHDAVFHPSALSVTRTRSSGLATTDALFGEMVGWCIERYYYDSE